ncbi:MAG TPA: hypothetical protein VEE84_09215 [Burkholderiaceae bacterium]|nr:hypothetical protein [Burkholderiaceae bacterium]
MIWISCLNEPASAPIQRDAFDRAPLLGAGAEKLNPGLALPDTSNP